MIILVRHASTDWNMPGRERVRGAADVPLNKKGRGEAKELGRRIAALYRPATVWSDHLQRGRETALAIARATGAVAVVDRSLRPWNIGSLTGWLKEKVGPRLRFLVENPRVSAPGGESYGDFYQRWKDRFNRARRAGGQAVYVVHSSNFHALPFILADGGPGYDAGADPAPGAFVAIN